MEKKIKIAGRIGNTVFQNNDSGKVLGGGGYIENSVFQRLQR